MEASEIALSASLLAVGATFVACVLVTVKTFLRAARQVRREASASGRLVHGSFGRRSTSSLADQRSEVRPQRAHSDRR
jgi:hypothetical protein